MSRSSPGPKRSVRECRAGHPVGREDGEAGRSEVVVAGPHEDDGAFIPGGLGHELLRAAGRRSWLWARDQGLGGAAGSTLVAVTETDIHAALPETRGLEEACRGLVTQALDRGSTDNVSVAEVDAGRVRRRSRPA